MILRTFAPELKSYGKNIRDYELQNNVGNGKLGNSLAYFCRIRIIG